MFSINTATVSKYSLVFGLMVEFVDGMLATKKWTFSFDQFFRTVRFITSSCVLYSYGTAISGFFKETDTPPPFFQLFLCIILNCGCSLVNWLSFEWASTNTQMSAFCMSTKSSSISVQFGQIVHIQIQDMKQKMLISFILYSPSLVRDMVSLVRFCWPLG